MPSILMGWPAIAASILIVALGLLSKRPWVVIAGALLGVPFFFYLAATPRFRGAALVPVVLQAIAGVSFVRRKPAVAAALCAPAVLFASYVLVVVQ
jgi:hypothetical protein